MSTETKKPRIVLAAVEESATAEGILELAGSLASGGAIHIIHVVDVDRASAQPMGFAISSSVMEAGRRLLEDLAREAEERSRGVVATHLCAGTVHREIARIARDVDADFVVVGSRKRGAVSRLVSGSVASRLVDESPCAIVVARDKEAPSSPRIEPPCPECVARRAATNDAGQWCARHASRHVHGRVHYEYPDSFGVGSMLIRS